MPIPQSVMLESLTSTSILAAQAFQRLGNAETPEDEATQLEWLWEVKANQEDLIDAHVELADQLDAEIAAVQARMDFLVQTHNVALNRLRRWRTALDHTVLKLNQSGFLGNEAIGNTRRICIKLNPPACEVTDMSQVPEPYAKTKLVPTEFVDKAAVKAAWNKGIHVPGTEVTRARKVVYELVPTSAKRLKQS